MASMEEMTSRDFRVDPTARPSFQWETILDEQTMNGYKTAICFNPKLFEGTTVLEVGSGVGMLSMFAAKAGAARVIALEWSMIADIVTETVKQNKSDHVITVVKALRMGLENHTRLPVAILFAAVLFLSCITGQYNAQESKKTFRETIDAANLAIEEWDPPDSIKKTIPYYFAGYDFDDHPIWLLEFGKYDLRGYFEEDGEEAVKLHEKYTDQFHYRIHNSPKQRPKNPQEPTTDFVLLIDMEGYNLQQLSSPIANFFAESILNLVKPALGGVLAKTTVYGTNKDNWLPKILKKIPRESLAEWYGGFKNYTPIAVYG